MSAFDGTVKRVKRLIVAVVGFTVIAVGLAMVVLPGPAIVVIPLGLGILASEFVWARRLLHHARERLARLKQGPKSP